MVIFVSSLFGSYRLRLFSWETAFTNHAPLVQVYSIDSRNLNIKDKTANDKYFSLGTTEFEEVLKDLTHRIFEREPARQRRAEEAATRRAAREAEARLQREEERRLEAVREAARQAAREAVLTKIREEKVALLVAQCPSIGEKGSAAEASGKYGVPLVLICSVSGCKYVHFFTVPTFIW